MNRRQALRGFIYDTWKNGNKVTAAQKATAEKVWRAFVNVDDPTEFWRKTLWYASIQPTYASRFVQPFARKHSAPDGDQITVGLRMLASAP